MTAANAATNVNIEILKQYVTFSMGNEMYGINVAHVQEVLYLIPITHVPNTMPFMKGVIDLRGMIVPLIDLRIKFKLIEREYDPSTVILIVTVHGSVVGFIVDSVSDVTSISAEQIQNTPHFSIEIDKDAVVAIGRYHDNLVIILEAEKIISKEEVDSIRFK